MKNKYILSVHLCEKFIKHLGNPHVSLQVMSVMTVTPKVFYTLDLRRVLKHLATGGSYETIPPPPVVPNIEITTPSANIRNEKLVSRLSFQ